MIISNFPSGGGKQLTATITATYPAGASITCTLGTEVLTGDTSGSYVFTVHDSGIWTVAITGGEETASEGVIIHTDGQAESVTLTLTRIFGIMRDITNSSPEWTRTDEAVGLTATASVGTSAGSSDFDNCYPWSGIARETLPSSDVMVKIPKFWYQRYRDGNNEYIRIADKAKEGFTLHPAFNHAGVEADYIYIGAYKTTSGNKSASGASPLANQTRATMRFNAKAKGTGWGIIDISALSAIQMLILVEFANNNVQTVIGRGYCDNTGSPLKTGTCDSVPNLTGRPAGTDGKVDVVWRGIEGFWGNAWEFVDGINKKGTTYYVCNTPADYDEDTATGYTSLSFTAGSSSGYIKMEGLDEENPHVMLPSATGGSDSTYYCDYLYNATTRSSWFTCACSGRWSDGTIAGLFTIVASESAPSSNSYSSRLIYIPS